MGQPPLLNDALGDEGYLPVEEQEAGHAVPGNQAELLLQALLHPLRDGAVAPHSRLHAQPSQVGVDGVPLRHGGIGQGVAQVRGQVEGALPGYLKGVGDEPPGSPGRGAAICSDGFRCRWWLGLMKGRAWSMVVLRPAATRAC